MTPIGRIAFALVSAAAGSILTLVAVFVLAPADGVPPPTATPQSTAPSGPAAPAGATPAATPAATAAPAGPALRRISATELAQHASAQSCWKAIDRLVYDVTAYVPRHPTAPAVILDWCGKDATAGWVDKGNGRPHSPRANTMLNDYLIGVLVP